jgi:hypothetical protein
MANNKTLVIDIKKAVLGVVSETLQKSESEFDNLPVEVAQVLQDKAVEKAKVDVAREIFEEIEKYLVTGTTIYGQRIYAIGVGTFAELKKKYTEENK